jgi:hypothetical protein
VFVPTVPNHPRGKAVSIKRLVGHRQEERERVERWPQSFRRWTVEAAIARRSRVAGSQAATLGMSPNSQGLKNSQVLRD